MSNQKNNQTLDVNESLAKTEAFFIKYKKQVITAVVVVLVIAGGIPAYIFGYSKPREEKAQECLGIVMQKYLMSQDYEHALKGEGKTLGLTKSLTSTAQPMQATLPSMRLVSATFSWARPRRLSNIWKPLT